MGRLERRWRLGERGTGRRKWARPGPLARPSSAHPPGARTPRSAKRLGTRPARSGGPHHSPRTCCSRAPTTVDLKVGTRTGSREIDLAFLQSLAERGDAFGSPSLFAYTLSTAAGGEVSLALGLRGALSTVNSGEVSGLTALVTGAASVTSGQSEACLCGAMDVSGSEWDGDRLVSARACATLPSSTRPGRLEALIRSGRGMIDSRDSLRSTMERLAVALAHAEAAEIGAWCPGGHSALLTVVPAAGATVRPGAVC